MSVGSVANNGGISSISGNETNKSEILSRIKDKLLNGIQNITEGHYRKLATLGQVSGVVGITIGALALIGTGVCSSVSGVGLPVGVALVCIGGALLLGGTAFAVIAAKKNENNKTVGDIFKDVFGQSIKNVKKGLNFVSSITQCDKLKQANPVRLVVELRVASEGEDGKKIPENQTTQQTSISKAAEKERQKEIEDAAARTTVENLLL